MFALFAHIANTDYDDDADDDDDSNNNANNNNRNCTTRRKKKEKTSTEMSKDTDGDQVASEDSQKDAKSDAEVTLLNRYIILHCVPKKTSPFYFSNNSVKN